MCFTMSHRHFQKLLLRGFVLWGGKGGLGGGGEGGAEEVMMIRPSDRGGSRSSG